MIVRTVQAGEANLFPHFVAAPVKDWDCAKSANIQSSPARSGKMDGVSLGIVLSFASAVLFSANRAFASKPLASSATTIAIYLGLWVGTAVLAIPLFLSAQYLDFGMISAIAVILFGLVGIFHYGVGRSLSFTAVKNIGANQAAPLITSQILYSLVLAVVLLGESMNLGMVLGSAAIVAGVFILEFRKSASKRGGNVKVGVTGGLLAGLIFGITPLMIKAGQGIFHYYVAATFLSYIASLIFYSFIVAPWKGISEAKRLPRSSLIAYVAAGTAAAGAQLSRFAALSYTNVVTVAPILSSHPLFTFLLTRKLASDVEVFRARTLLAIALIIVGAAVVSYSSGVTA